MELLFFVLARKNRCPVKTWRQGFPTFFFASPKKEPKNASAGKSILPVNGTEQAFEKLVVARADFKQLRMLLFLNRLEPECLYLGAGTCDLSVR